MYMYNREREKENTQTSECAGALTRASSELESSDSMPFLAS